MRFPRTPGEVSQELAGLAALDLEGLQRRWRSLTGRAAPAHVPRHFLVRLVAYRIQANAFGDLDSQSIKLLRQLARRRAAESTGASVPTLEALALSARGAGARSLTPGTVIGREHGGAMHHIMVLAEGFAWNGNTYRSLSEVAFAITGTKWNGPRFFGLTRRRKVGLDVKGTHHDGTRT